MNVYFLDDDEREIKTIKSVTDEWNGKRCRFFVNKSLQEIMTGIKDNEKTVLFLDTRTRVQDMGGFEIACKIRGINKECHIVYVSSYPEDINFCFKNFVRPSGFLLKPVSKSDYLNMLSSIEHIYYEQIRKKKIHLSAGGALYSFLPNDIIYFTTVGKKLMCKKTNDEEMEFYGTLSELEVEYGDSFIRCHSGFLVNRSYITGMVKNCITLRYCSETLPVSKKYKTIVSDFLKNEK